MPYKNYNEHMNTYMKTRYKNRRQETIAKLGGKCKECGETENLELDHINPDEKESSLAKLSSASKQRWEQEVKKCQLLCKECHKKKHSSKAVCGTPQKYWRGCRCRPCTDANTSWARNSAVRVPSF